MPKITVVGNAPFPVQLIHGSIEPGQVQKTERTPDIEQYLSEGILVEVPVQSNETPVPVRKPRTPDTDSSEGAS